MSSHWDELMQLTPAQIAMFQETIRESLNNPSPLMEYLKSTRSIKMGGKRDPDLELDKGL